MTAPTSAPAPSRRSALVGAALAGAGAAALAASPALRSAVPPCPFHLVTGLDCPGCGGTRAGLALAQGDLAAAVSHNAVAVLVVLPLAIVLFVAALRGRGRPPVFSHPQLLPVVAAVLLVFTVLRNLGGPFSGLDAG